MTVIAQPVAPARPFRTTRTILALMLREMQTTYGRNPGGYIWAVLQPVGAIAMLTFVFSVGLRIRTPPLGSNFALFYATGFLPYTLAMTTASKTASALQYSRALLAYPGVQYIDALLARFFLNVLTHLVVFIIVITGIHVIFDVSTIRNLSAIGTAFGLAAILGFGIGTLNCFLFSMVPIWKSVWSIVTRPLMLVSGVLFIFEDIPWQFRDYAWWNPLIHITGLMRRGFYATYEAHYVSPIYVLAVGVICLVFGLLFLLRFHRDILNL